jgi:MerR family transcriptional regulator, light-induced transcriptional regulator
MTEPPLISYLADDGRPLRELARSYLAALLRADRAEAIRMVMAEIERGADLGDVFLDVLQDSQREAGRLWSTNQISVAKEHFCTAVTQQIIAQLYPRVMAQPKSGLRALVACVSGEQHELGARMVADFLELAGWDAVYLGRDTPAAALADAVREYAPDLVGLSASMAFNFPVICDSIAAVRRADATGRLKVLVGGFQFDAQPDLWVASGADGYAPDGRAATLAAAALLQDRSENAS